MRLAAGKSRRLSVCSSAVSKSGGWPSTGWPWRSWSSALCERLPCCGRFLGRHKRRRFRERDTNDLLRAVVDDRFMHDCPTPVPNVPFVSSKGVEGERGALCEIPHESVSEEELRVRDIYIVETHDWLLLLLLLGLPIVLFAVLSLVLLHHSVSADPSACVEFACASLTRGSGVA